MSYQWFRMWADAIDDEKLRLLAFEDRWHFVALLCLKRIGLLDEPESDLKKQKICIKLGLDSMELETVMKRLVTVGLITEALQPIAWSKRQFESDSSTSRVRAFRKRQRNKHETFRKRPQTTDSDTDTPLTPSGGTDSLCETEEGTARPEGLDNAAWTRWLEYRRQIKRPLKQASIPAAQRKLAAFGADQAAVVEQSIADGYQGLFELKQRSKSPQEKSEWL